MILGFKRLELCIRISFSFEILHLHQVESIQILNYLRVFYMLQLHSFDVVEQVLTSLTKQLKRLYLLIVYDYALANSDS
jgi:hypothetical protein